VRKGGRSQRPPAGPWLAVGAAAGFALSVPLGKWLLDEVGSFSLAGILYLGAGIGLSLYRLIVRGDAARSSAEGHDLSPTSRRRSRLFLAASIASGGIIAPALLYFGLSSLAASSVSLFLSLEVVLTAILAGLLFREHVPGRVWAAVALMAGASSALAWQGGHFGWSLSAIAVILATFFWGLDNSLTREVHGYSPAVIVQIKGLVAGTFNLIIGVFVAGETPSLLFSLLGLALGAVSYGLSLILFVRALRLLGSARTGAYFSTAPLIGAVLSLIILREHPGWSLAVAFVLVVGATILMITERHVHAHSHGGLVHTHHHWPDEEHRHAH